MTTQQYLAALKKLGLTRASRTTAAALGCSVRQIMRYAAGDPIPQRVEMLLELRKIDALRIIGDRRRTT